MKWSILLFLLLLDPFTPQLWAQDKIVADPDLKNKDKFPIPKEDDQLFYLQRDPNTNTVIYTLNINDGEIDEHSPVKAHWIRYAEDGQRSDLSFIQRIPSLRRFSADCLMDAKGIDVVTQLENLEHLGVGIFNLDNFDFLDKLNPNLKEIYLHQTRSKKPKINSLERFEQLEYLYLE